VWKFQDHSLTSQFGETETPTKIREPQDINPRYGESDCRGRKIHLPISRMSTRISKEMEFNAPSSQAYWREGSSFPLHVNVADIPFNHFFLLL
jgi:hypothetical protein